MSKKHIITIGYMHYAFDSIKAATDCLVILNRATLCQREYESGKTTYKPNDDPHRCNDLELTLNQHFESPRPPKAEKRLSLPAPKRGSILCLCEKSYVAPKQTCPSCGLAFNVSHSRTHQDTSTANSPTLRLV